MPSDRFALLRFIVALFVLVAFSLAGLMARIGDDHRRLAVSVLRPAIAVHVARQP